MKLSIEEQTFLLKAIQEVKEHKEREVEEIKQELERIKNKLNSMEKRKPLFVDPKVNDPMWFPKAKNNELTEGFIEGYSQAVYQIRLLISSLQEEPTGEIKKYTELMLKELYSNRDNQNK
jgi:hypothetical protein